uniref:Nuclear pore protein n=1 Tax=Elaeophora elaphi TaxID=1147741 RepID=A0A0R3RXD0_9BILA
MPGALEDLLNKSDRLSVPSKVISKTSSGSSYKTRVDLALNDVFRRSEDLWKKKASADEHFSDVEVGLLLGGKGFSLSSVPQMQEAAVENEVEELVVPSADCEHMLNEIVAETSIRTRLEAERAFMNQRIVDEAYTTPKYITRATASTVPFSKTTNLDSSTSIKPGDIVELTFAKGVSDYIVQKKVDALTTAFKEAASISRDDGIVALWGQALAPLNQPFVVTGAAKNFRSSVSWMNHIVDTTLEFLHKNFISYMETVVENNLAVARRGGNPTMLSLINAFLNVKHLKPTQRHTQDGVYGSNGHALWEVVYHCLRAGELQSAAKIADSHLKNLPSCAAATIALLELEKSKKLSADVRLKVKAEWRYESRSFIDIYKKAVYCALLGGDVPEVCNNLENWLWLKLYPCGLDPALSPAVFRELQRLISVDYGESYFVGNDGSVLIYFQALWLTGQYERAINLLYRNNMLTHAVHIAILLHLNNVLILVDDIGHPMLLSQQEDPVQSSLNFCRLLLLYMKRFECTDAERTLDYAYFLNKMESPVGGNLFYSCISRAVYLSDETWRIIGKINENGIRYEGLIDKYARDISIEDAIAKVASDTEVSGDGTLAGQLYMAANHVDDAVRLACDSLAKEITQHKDDGEARKFALWLASICKHSANATKITRRNKLDALPTLYLLLDLSTFFQFYYDKKFNACMEIIKKLKCIPMNPDEVQAFVSTFYMVSDQMRLVLPDLCVAVMKLLAEELDRNPAAGDELRPSAKAIILYIAMIPYRFPSRISTQILQLNTIFE